MYIKVRDMYSIHKIAKLAIYTCMLGLICIATGCASQGPNGNTKSTPAVGPSATVGSSATVGPTNGAVDTIVDQVLTNMHQHAWNPNALTKSNVTGGLFINWKMSDPSITNATKLGTDDATQGLHDPQVDLLYLTALTEFQQLHPQVHTYDADLTLAVKIVINDFAKYSLPKGWIYFYLLKDGQALRNQTLQDEAHTIAQKFYTTWYDPALGLVYQRLHTPPDYATNNTLQCGAALIDAGQRWQQPTWVDAGKKTLDHVLANAFNPTYNLFYDQMLVGSDGHDQPEGEQAKPSTQGEAITSLLTAYKLIHSQAYLSVSGQVLQSLFGASGLWDKGRGGFYFDLNLNSDKLVTSYKETRSQTLMLIALHQYNQLQHGQFAEQENAVASALINHFYLATYHGFVYRLTPNFQIYTSKAGQGIGQEDFFTTEAMGSAMDALQQREM